MGQYSKVETDGRLMIVTINRPEVYNACHPMANEELVAAFDEFQRQPRAVGRHHHRRRRQGLLRRQRPEIPRRDPGQDRQAAEPSAEGLRRPRQPLRPRQAGDRRGERRRHGRRLRDRARLRHHRRVRQGDLRAARAQGRPRRRRRRHAAPVAHDPAQEGDGHDADRPPRPGQGRLRAGLRHRGGAARRADERRRGAGPTRSSPARRCRCAPPSRS